MADKDYTADDMKISPTARQAMEKQEAQRKLDAEQESRQKAMEDGDSKKSVKNTYSRLREMFGVKPTAKKAKGGTVGSASKRGDGCAVKGKTRGRMV
jgi:hypothetical protein